jgi:hypothetical protein
MKTPVQFHRWVAALALILIGGCRGSPKSYVQLEPVSIETIPRRDVYIEVKPWIDQRHGKTDLMNGLLLFIPLWPYAVNTYEGTKGNETHPAAAAFSPQGQGQGQGQLVQAVHGILPLLCKYLQDARVSEQVFFNAKPYANEEIFESPKTAVDIPEPDLIVRPIIKKYEHWLSLTFYGTSVLGPAITLFLLCGAQNGVDAQWTWEVVDRKGQVVFKKDIEIHERSGFRPVYALFDNIAIWPVTHHVAAKKIHGETKTFVEELARALPPPGDPHWQVVKRERTRRLAIAQGKKIGPEIHLVTPADSPFRTSKEKIDVELSVEGKYSPVRTVVLSKFQDELARDQRGNDEEGFQAKSIKASVALDDGTNPIVVEATDADGNVTRETVIVDRFVDYLAMAGAAQTPSIPVKTETPRKPDKAGVLPTDAFIGVGRNNRWKALLIACSEYRNPKFPTLNSPPKDIHKLGDILRKQYGFDVTTLGGAEASFLGIRAAFKNLQETCKPEDNVLIYYAGHGFEDEASHAGYWLPTDAQDNNEGLANVEIKDRIARLPARRVLLVSDACFSGEFLTRRSISASAASPIEDEKKSVEISVALARNLNPSREIITSGNREPVQDAGVGYCADHSPFACALITALEKVPLGAALSSTDLYVDVYGSLRSNPAYVQKPQRGTIEGHNGGEFFLVHFNNSE